MNEVSGTDAESVARVAVVTGAGSGIGRAVARKLLAEGWNVALAGRRPEPIAATGRGFGERALAVPTDVSAADDVERLFDEVAHRWGRVDVLFNNAGVFGPFGDVSEIEPAAWEATVAVNLTGSFLCAAAAFRAMKEQSPRGGRIINNGSISAHSPRPKSVAYTATKHAISGLTKSIELDGRPYGITCGQIDIGNTRTELIDALIGNDSVGEGALQANGSRLVEPTFPLEEAANAVFLMASLPPSATVGSLVITASGMPFVGRG
ncbi:SDR family oxidoreductase [Sinomonas sp. P47F7]|uniref:SDR family oxidoreductase n=1 Tax=Sinomonas sp. P47F7 TaxID=3410987 RepID=UPI003BF4A088